MSQNTKKVLFTSHTANFSKFNRPFMRWFKEQNYEVHYASDGEEAIVDADRSFKISFERSPLRLNNLRAIRQLKKIMDTEYYDIIHTHTPMGSIITRIAARKTRKKGTRVIYTAHGFHFFKGAPLLNWVIYYPIEKIMARLTDTIVTINKEDYKRAGAKFNTNVEYIPGTGVDSKKFTHKLGLKVKQNLRQGMGVNEDDFVLIYVAELSKRKRQLWLIETVSEYIINNPNVHLLLVGEDSLSNNAQRLTKKLNLEKNIHFLGYRQDVADLMQISDLAVSSSSQEGLPVNIMEALFSNLPIVATECRGTNELMVNNSNCYLVDKNDRIGFVDAIRDVRSKPISSVARVVTPYMLSEIIVIMSQIYSKAKTL